MLKDIGKVERPMFAHPENPWLINTDLDSATTYRTKMSPRNHTVPFIEPQCYVINPAYFCGALDDGVEHRLHVRRRAADDAEHLRCCLLMLQRFGELTPAILQ